MALAFPEGVLAALRRDFQKVGRNRYPLPHALAGVVVILGAVVGMEPVAPDLIAANAGNHWATDQNDHQKSAKRAAAALLPVPRRAAPGEERATGFTCMAQAARAVVYRQVVVSRIMPMNNATGITEAERGLLKQWFEAGVKTP